MFKDRNELINAHSQFYTLVKGLKLEPVYLKQLANEYYYGNRIKAIQTINLIRGYYLKKYDGICIPPLIQETIPPKIVLGKDNYYGNVHGIYDMDDFWIFVLRGPMGSGKSSTFHSVTCQVLAENPDIGFVKIELKRPEFRHFKRKVEKLTGRKLWVISKEAFAFNPFQIFIKTLDHLSTLGSVTKTALGLYESGPTLLLFTEILRETYIDMGVFDGKSNVLPQNEDFPVLSEFIDIIKDFPVKDRNKSEGKTRLLDKFTGIYNSTGGDNGCFSYKKGIDLNVLQHEMCVIELFGLPTYVQRFITLLIFRNLYELRMMSL